MKYKETKNYASINGIMNKKKMSNRMIIMNRINMIVNQIKNFTYLNRKNMILL
jgi:hypothetical protein